MTAINVRKSASSKAPSKLPSLLNRVPIRSRLAVGGAAAGLLAFVTLLLGLNFYENAFNQAQAIALNSKAKVDGAEKAEQDIAAVDTNAADFVITAPDSTTHWADVDTIRGNFASFRQQMFDLKAVLDTPAEISAYNDAEQFSFDQFWQHIGILLSAELAGDSQTASREYLIADNYMENQIVPTLHTLENLNFDAMQRTEQDGNRIITVQTVILGAFAIGLAVMLTVFSFWLRRKVRRYLTPGIDIGLALTWIVALLMLFELGRLPGQIKNMVEDSYFSVTASQRVLAIVNQTNRTESAELADPDHAAFWQKSFDSAKLGLEIRLCGYSGCTQKTFTEPIRDEILISVITAAGKTKTLDGETVVPLVANVTYPGEATALEQARTQLSGYFAVDGQLRYMLAKKQFEQAVALDTGTNEGQSNFYFNHFVDAMKAERDINSDKFDETWKAIQATIPPHRLLLALAGYALVIVGLSIGVAHRYREL